VRPRGRIGFDEPITNRSNVYFGLMFASSPSARFGGSAAAALGPGVSESETVRLISPLDARRVADGGLDQADEMAPRSTRA